MIGVLILMIYYHFYKSLYNLYVIVATTLIKENISLNFISFIISLNFILFKFTLNRRRGSMIESKIKVLRKAAKVSTMQDSDKLWCVIAGNEDMVNNVAYDAIISKDRVKILFREHITMKESFVTKKFDFIMFYGNEDKIRDLSLICKENGGAYLKIASYYVKNEPDLLLIVGPDNAIKKFAGDSEKNNLKLSFIIEDRTTGFIETDVYITKWLPNFIRNIIDPLFKITDVVLLTILISTEEKHIAKIKEIAKLNKIFVLEFEKILEEE